MKAGPPGGSLTQGLRPPAFPGCLGLHPALSGFKALWDDGQLAIVQGVGYPDPDRSHFVSTAIWETAIRDARQQAGIGWIGAALDRRKRGAVTGTPTTDAVYIGSKSPPVALSGRRTIATNLTSLRDFQVSGTAELRRIAQQTADPTSRDGDPRAFLRRVALGAYAAADRLSAVQAEPREVVYPSDILAKQLQLAATLIANDHPAQVYYLSHAGYDTHFQQLNPHANLLSDLGNAVRAFLADVEDLGQADSVAVMMFSEFGRSMYENGSAGTDHGTAGPVFLAGAPVQPGLVGETPSLGDLVDGQPKWSIDFRQIYATVEMEWFGLQESSHLGGAPARLPLFRG